MLSLVDYFFSFIIVGYLNTKEINDNLVIYFIGTRYHLELLLNQLIGFEFISLF